MKKDAGFYWKLFCATFSLSAFTFGGGYVIVPLMRERFVNHYHWIEEPEMLDIVAISQSSPGPMAVNASILVGYRMAGIPGAACTILGTVLPPFMILTVISMFYEAFMASALVAALLKGMRVGVAAVIIDVVIGMASSVLKGKKNKALPIAIMAGAFTAVYFLKINVAFVVIGCGLFGLLLTLWQQKKEEKGEVA